MNASYIHEFKTYDSFVESFNSFCDFVNSHESKMNAYENKKDMLIYMEESTEDVEYMMESENKGFFESIGEKVVAILKKFNDAMETLMEKIKSIFHKPSAKDNAAAAMQKNPKLAKAFLDGIENGSIKYSDYKDINEMIDTAEKITNDIYNNKIGVEEGEDQYKKCMEKLNGNLKPAREFLENVAGIGLAAVSILGLKNAIMKLTVDAGKNRAKINNMKAQAIKKMKDDPEESKKVRTVTSWNMKIMEKAIAEHSSVMKFLYSLASKITNIDITGGNNRKGLKDFTKEDYKRTIDSKSIKSSNKELMASNGNFPPDKKKPDKKTQDKKDDKDKK